ncbi:hypothetical protein M422DRAFT_206455, partial [Sphaerobolus stellatus SS14]
MQWLREYRKYTGVFPDKATLSIRQMRFEGLHKWGVPEIISALPILLQVAVILFFVGLIDFLWHINITVALPVVVCIGFVLLFIIFTTVAPTIQASLPASFVDVDYRTINQCPYKSPQSWLFILLSSWTLYAFTHYP